MLRRPAFPTLIISALLTSCAYFGNDTSDTSTLTNALLPAEVPAYAQGDRYTYDNPNETWTVANIADDLLQWKSSLGTSQVTVFDPLMPPVEWTGAEKTRSTRKILEWKGRLFPLKAGNRMSFKEAVRIGEDGAPTHFNWTCSAERPRQAHVSAGQFAVYPVSCTRNDGFRAEGDYAPAINKAISIRYTEVDGWTTTRSLQSFALGSGQRIAAKPQTSLPHGWSEAAVERPAPRVATPTEKDPPPLSTAAATTGPTTAATGTATRTVAVNTDARKADARKAPKKAAVSGGRYLVQLSSLASPVSARNEWTRLQKVYPALLGQRDLVMEKRLIAGRGTFYRVQTGRYETLTEARALCNELKVRKQGCLAIKR